jgi:hypothetical protein
MAKDDGNKMNDKIGQTIRATVHRRRWQIDLRSLYRHTLPIPESDDVERSAPKL